MLARLKRQWQRRQLKDPRYATLFEELDEEVVSVDCETTSLKVQEAELLSIGAVRLRGNRILSSQSFYVLVKPTRKLESRNISIHGLRPMDVSEGLDADTAVRQLLDFIGGRPLVGYYLEYDVAVLNKYVRAITGISLPNRQIEISGRYYDYKFKQNPGAYIDLRLSVLNEDLQIPALPRHDALNDAITAGMLYLSLQQRGFG
jgi:DNA polymerase-3 subunit epsilon